MVPQGYVMAIVSALFLKSNKNFIRFMNWNPSPFWALGFRWLIYMIMKYLSPQLRTLIIESCSPMALSFGGSTEPTDANYIDNVIYDEEDEEW